MCPLLTKVIDDAYCYEINSIAYGFIKPEAIEDKIDRDTAIKYCDNCPHNQMKDK